MLQTALDLWAAHFDGPPTVIGRAPGRVNLIGEHTDYSEGFVFPVAIDLAVTILARPADEESLISVQVPDAVDHRGPGWRRYVHACRSALESRRISVPPLEAVISSTVPGGSGLSSSAALELAFLCAWNHVANLGLSPKILAEVAWQAENEFVGVKVGRMDQMASAMGVEGCALFMDMRSLDVEPCQLPEGIEIAILDTRKPRSLAAGKYNERVAECRRALDAISARRSISALRDATIGDLEAARSDGLDAVAHCRARHVITENDRVLKFKTAIERRDLREIGDLCGESHQSLREDFEVTVPELDAMVRAAKSAPGCIAARMTGAGFGGCCVAILEAGAFPAFREATTASYGMYGFVAPNLFLVKASEGARATDFEGVV